MSRVVDMTLVDRIEVRWVGKGRKRRPELTVYYSEIFGAIDPPQVVAMPDGMLTLTGNGDGKLAFITAPAAQKT